MFFLLLPNILLLYITVHYVRFPLFAAPFVLDLFCVLFVLHLFAMQTRIMHCLPDPVPSTLVADTPPNSPPTVIHFN